MKTPLWPIPLESEVQKRVVEIFDAAGFRVRSTSQYRPSEVSLGLPDLRLHHRTLSGLGGDFETKRPVRRWVDQHGATVAFHPFQPETYFPEGLTPSQLMVREDALRACHWHAFGGAREAIALLVRMGLARYFGRTLNVEFRPGGRWDASDPYWQDSREAAVAWLAFVDRNATSSRGKQRGRAFR